MTLAWLTIGVLVCLTLRVPVAFALLVPSFVYIQLDDTLNAGLALQRIVAGVNSFPLVAVPLFVMTGFIANQSGISDRLFEFLEALFARMRGGLGYVNIYSSVAFSWMSGAAVSDAAGLGSVLVPAMRKRGYNERFSVGLTAASASIGPVMPPSIPAIVYGVTAGVSIGSLFLAGVLPAFVIALVLSIGVWLYARKHPELSPQKADIRDIVRTGVRAVPILFAPVIILGGILGGVFTPTEAAAAAAGYLLLVGIVLYRALHLREMWDILSNTARTTASIMLIVGASSLFSWILTRERAPALVADFVIGLTDSKVLFLLGFNVLILVVGMLLEPVSAILILAPILVPAATALGISPVHLGVVMILNLTIGLLTPPVGLVLFVLSSVTDIPFRRVLRATAPFLIPLVISLLLITYIPEFSLTLPRLAGLGG